MAVLQLVAALQLGLQRPVLLAAPRTRWGLLLVEGGRWRLQDPQGLALSNAVLRDVLEWCREQQQPGAAAGR